MAYPSKDASDFDCVDATVAQWLKSSTPFQRIQMASELNEMAREIVAGEIRDGHPDWADLAVKNEVARRFLADENLPMLYAKDLFESPVHREAYFRASATAALANEADR